MRPLPDLTDEAAMLRRGRMSALGAARNEALQALRDAFTHAQSAEYRDLPAALEAMQAPIERLRTVAAMWETA